MTGYSTKIKISPFPVDYNFNNNMMLTTISENLRNYMINHFLDMELESRKIIYDNNEISNFIGMLSSQDNDTVRLAISIISGMNPSYITQISVAAGKTGCAASSFFSDLTTLEEMMMIWTPIYINEELYYQKYPQINYSGVMLPNCSTNINLIWNT